MGMHTKMEVTVPKQTRPDGRRAAAAPPRRRAPFRELYDRYAERIYGYHLRRTRDRDAAHDLAAETFAQAWLSRRRFRDEAGGSAGAVAVRDRAARGARVGRSAAIERRRDAARRARAARPPAAATRPTRRGSTAREGLDEALEELPEGQREAIELRIVDDLSLRGGRRRARHLPARARVRVHRGLRTLRSLLTDGTEATR